MARVVSTERVLRDFAKVVENESEKDPRVIARELELELRAADNDQNVAVLQRVMAWVEEATAKAQSPLGRLRCAITRKLPNVLRLHKELALPSDRELIDLAHHFYPPRGQLKVEVFDFGDNRAEHSKISLAEVRKLWTEKPDWVIVRWIHAPLGIGLLHSTVEDLFRHAGPSGAEFSNAGSPDWPYVECEILNFRSCANFQNSRDVCLLLRNLESLNTKLDATAVDDIKDDELIKDIEWRSDHLAAPTGYWDLVSADMAWQFSEGLGAGLSGPHAGLKPIGRQVDQQILSQHPFYRRSQVVRSSFRCFHRSDGYLLSLSPPIGVNYLDKNFSRYIQEPVDSLFDNCNASALANVFSTWAEDGTKFWGRKTVEWFLIYLITEVCATPHSIRSGHSAPDIGIAYHSIVQDLKRKRNDKWKQHDAAGLVKDYTTCIDEISVIVEVFQRNMAMLQGLKEDICQFEREEIEDTNCGFEDSKQRVNWSIRVLGNQLTRLETMLSDMRKEMDALFQLRSIQQGELAISTDSTSKAVLVFTGVTIIFLPLSFFTSYFGMNLRGIQNTSKTESYFWAVCGSIAFTIVVATIIYAFRHTIWKRRVENDEV